MANRTVDFDAPDLAASGLQRLVEVVELGVLADCVVDLVVPLLSSVIDAPAARVLVRCVALADWQRDGADLAQRPARVGVGQVHSAASSRSSEMESESSGWMLNAFTIAA